MVFHLSAFWIEEIGMTNRGRHRITWACRRCAYAPLTSGPPYPMSCHTAGPGRYASDPADFIEMTEKTKCS